jgi:hypothetical protein
MGPECLWLDRLGDAWASYDPYLTDLIDTLVLTCLMFSRHGDNPRRYGDVSDNAMYWNFVVATWLPMYMSASIGYRAYDQNLDAILRTCRPPLAWAVGTQLGQITPYIDCRQQVALDARLLRSPFVDFDCRGCCLSSVAEARRQG